MMGSSGRERAVSYTHLTSTMVNVINNNNLDLLHVHYAIPHASAAYFARQILKKTGKDIPYITTLHGTDITLVGKDQTYAPVVCLLYTSRCV